MKRIKFLPTVYMTLAILASVLFLTQIQSQKNLSIRKGLQDATNIAAKDAPLEASPQENINYGAVPGEYIVTLSSGKKIDDIVNISNLNFSQVKKIAENSYLLTDTNIPTSADVKRIDDSFYQLFE